MNSKLKDIKSLLKLSIPGFILKGRSSIYLEVLLIEVYLIFQEEIG